MPTDGTLLVCESTVRCTVNGTYWGAPVANVFDVRYDMVGDPEPSVRDMLDNFQDHIMDFLSAGYTIVSCDWLDLDSETGPTGTIAPDAGKNLVGQQAGDDLPANSSFLCHKNVIASRGTRNGRSYFVGVRDAWIGDDGAVSAPGLAVINPLLELFKDGINDASQHLAVVHVPSTIEGGVRITHPSEAFETEVSTFICDAKIATQRQRLRR